MPARKRSYKPRPRRRRKRRSKIGFRRACVPNKMVAKLRYASVHDLTWGSVTEYSDYVFRANSLYDPDLTGGGHQPRGFDQYMSMYDHYTVVGSKITVTFSNESDTSASNPIVCAIALTDNSTPIQSKWSDIMERSDVKSCVIAHPEGGNAVRTCSKGFGAKKFFGCANVMDRDDLKGDVISNPSEGAFFHIMNAVDGLTTDRAVQIQVLVDYLVVFTEPKQPDES